VRRRATGKVLVTNLRLQYLRRARAAILSGVEVIEGCVGGLGGEPLDAVAARAAVAMRNEIGLLTDAILIAESALVARVGKLG